jgi:acetylornithine deacetylase/succinyl-diaminopimelate desuccinylase-like protein
MCIPVCVPRAAQKIEFSSVKPSVLEERLGRVRSKIQEREQTLRALFESAGCAGDQLQEQAVKGDRTPNLICTLEGSADATVIVAAHYDKVPNGAGVVDDWSGASMLPSLYESLKGSPRHVRFRFIEFTREEEGLVGSKFYVKHLDGDEKSKIRAMVNLECLGLTPTKVWVHRADQKLVEIAARVAQATKLEVSGMNVEKVGDSDSRPFADAGIPVIDFHSVTQETLPIHHSNRDRMAANHLPDYQDSYRFLTAFLAYLDVAMEPKAPAETR